MASGWIKAHRTMLEHPLLQAPEAFMLWMRLLLTAAHKPAAIRFKGQSVPLARGQCACVLVDMARKCGLSRQQMRTVIDAWLSEQMLVINPAPGNAYSVVTICNYEIYQGEGDGDEPSEQPRNLTNQSATQLQPRPQPSLQPSFLQEQQGNLAANNQAATKVESELQPTEQEDKKDKIIHSAPSERANGPQADSPPVDAKTVLWREMKDWLGGKRAGGLVGKWCKEFGEGEVFATYFRARTENPAERVSWMTAALKANAGHRARPPPRATIEGTMRYLHESGLLNDERPEDEPDSGGLDAAPHGLPFYGLN